MGDEQPSAVVVLPQLVNELVGGAAVQVADIDDPLGLQRREQGCTGIFHVFAAFVQLPAAVGGNGVDKRGSAAEEDQPAACVPEGFQTLKRGGAQRFASGHDHGVVGHFAHLQGRAARFAEAGQQRFADEVEIDAAGQQPVCKGDETVVHVGADRVRLVGGAPVEPVALHGMDHAHLHYGLAAGQRGVHAGEVVLHRAVFLIPRALVTDGGGVVAFCFALHRVP